MSCGNYKTRIVRHATVPWTGKSPELVKVGDRVFVAADANGLYEVDVTDPLQPTLTLQLPLQHSALSVVTDGSTLFVGGEDGVGRSTVSAFDITGGVQFVSYLRLGNLADQFQTMTLEAGMLYVASGADGLFLVDVTNPAAMIKRSRYSAGVGVEYTGVTVSGTTAYVTRAGYSVAGIETIDASNPTAPVSLAVLTASALYERRSPVLVGSDLYAVATWSNGSNLLRYDVTDPTQPTQVEGWQLWCGTRVRRSGDRLYVVGDYSPRYGSQQYGQITVLDISGPTPVLSTTLRPYGGYDIVVEPPFAYIPSQLDGLEVCEILDEGSVPAAAVSEIDYPYPPPFGFLLLETGEIAMNGGFGLSMGTGTFDAGYSAVGVVLTWYLSNPLVVGADPLQTTHTGSEVDVGGGHSVFVGSTLETYTNTFVGSAPLPGPGSDVKLDGNYAYVATQAGTVEIVDVTDDTNPTNVGSVTTTGIPGDLAISGGYMYVTDDVDGLHVFDLSNPVAPLDVTGGLLAQPMDGVAVEGSLAFTKDSATGNLVVLDVTDPATPVALGSTTVSTGSKQLLTVPDHGFVYSLFALDYGTGPSGFEVVDVSDPSAPFSVENEYGDSQFFDIDTIALDGDVIEAFGGDEVRAYPLACESAGAVGAPRPSVAPITALRAIPNPFRTFTGLQYAAPGDGAGRAVVYDVAGKLVRRLTAATRSGAASVRWDGRDGEGNAVAPGLYFIRVSGEQGKEIGTARVVRLR